MKALKASEVVSDITGQETSARAKPARQPLRLVTKWPKLLAGSAMVAFVGGLLTFKLSSLLSASPTEAQAIQQAQSLTSLSDNILLAPYKILTYAMMQLPGSDLLHIRLTSVIITCVSVWLFFVLAKRWYGTVAGIWTSLAFASSTWLLQTGRFGTAYCMLILMVLALLNLAAWISTTPKHGTALLVFAIVSGLALFTPGGVWFVLMTVILLSKPLLVHRSKAKPQQSALAAAIFVALLACLSSGLAQNIQIARQWLGLPDQFPALGIIARQAAGSISYFIFRGPVMPEVWLAHTPLLDVASVVLLFFGIIFYTRHLRNTRTRLLLGFSLISILLISVNGAAALNYAVPIIYLIIGGGVAYIMHQWNRTFPHNPIARSVSLILIGGLLLIIIGFHTIRYFVAWRYSPDTVQAYSQDQAQRPMRTLLE